MARIHLRDGSISDLYNEVFVVTFNGSPEEMGIVGSLKLRRILPRYLRPGSFLVQLNANDSFVIVLQGLQSEGTCCCMALDLE